jgi:hypothetical protein
LLRPSASVEDSLNQAIKIDVGRRLSSPESIRGGLQLAAQPLQFGLIFQIRAR